MKSGKHILTRFSNLQNSHKDKHFKKLSNFKKVTYLERSSKDLYFRNKTQSLVNYKTRG